MSYLYSLRLAVDPGSTDEHALANLPDFVADARVDDVMVFANVEELNTGHTDAVERAVFRDLAERVAAVSSDVGASMSLNPWHTVMHGDYGKRLRPGQDFRLMVDPTGRRADLTVCPMDPAWRSYLAELYGFYAAARPRFLWVEDDFRYHNHWPLEWGGCFCEAHLAEFSRRAGRELTREEFVTGMLATGEPHEFRRIWLDVAQEGLERAAAAIEQAVHAVSPDTRLGLMTSVPLVHAAEGRRWQPLLQSLSGGHPPAVRIHLPAYAERRPADYLALFHTIADVHRALLPAGAEVYPELESFPYSRFSKSLAFTRFQLLGAQVIAPAGMTVDLFDLNGNGLVPEEGYQQVLADAREYLDTTLASGVFTRPRLGVQVLVSEDSSGALQTGAGESMTELYPREYLFGALLGGYGIPFGYTTDAGLRGAIVAASGQIFRTLGVAATRALVENNHLLLDAEAVHTLVQLGLGELVAARAVAWASSYGGPATYEEAAAGVELLGRPGARASVLLMDAQVGIVDYQPDRVDVITRLRGPGHVDAGPGHVQVDSRALVIPFAHCDPLQPPPAMLRTTLRQELLHRVVGGWDAEMPRLVGATDVALYAYPDRDSIALYLVNAGLDPLVAPVLWLGPRDVSEIVAWPSSGSDGPVAFRRSGGEFQLDLRLPPLEAVLLWVRH